MKASKFFDFRPTFLNFPQFHRSKIHLEMSKPKMRQSSSWQQRENFLEQLQHVMLATRCMAQTD
jgi:hypothetical protein